MSDREPSEITEAFWAALAARDWAAVAGFFDGDSEYWDIPIGRENGAVGPENIVERLKLGIEPLAGYQNHTERTVTEGDVVVTIHTETWVWDDEHLFTLEFSSYQRLRDGVIAEWRDYSDIGSLMAAAPAWWHERLASSDLRWRSGRTG